MKLSATRKKPEQCRTEALLVGHYEDSSSLAGAAKALDEASGGLLSHLLETGDFSGKRNETALVYTRDLLPAKRILLLGLGKKEEITPEKLRVAFADGARKIRAKKVRDISISLNFGEQAIPLDKTAMAAVEGITLGLYRFSNFKKKDPDAGDITSATFIENSASAVQTLKESIQEAQIICDAVLFARDLVSMPSNEMTPAIMAREARRLGRGSSLEVKIIQPPAMKQMGMHALLGVGRGSAEPPKLIVMNYRGGKPKDKPVVLAGKGITFDSGGISLKPAAGMDQMKDDMAGGAAVMGVLKAVTALELPLNVVGLVPAVENMPDGQAYKPGDILKSLSGQTIEVINTDAEGRLILADTLAYAKRFKPAAVIDIATLTGACVIALGDYLTAMLGNDATIKDRLRDAAETTGEALWELPLWEEYDDLIKSDVADMKNTGGRGAGTITAALFLKRFVDDMPWVHLDIAGTSFSPKDKGYIPKGPSGAGVRLLVEFLKNWPHTKANESNS